MHQCVSIGPGNAQNLGHFLGRQCEWELIIRCKIILHSFAAEVRYHAMFLNAPARIRLPIVGSPYASAVRADMSIGDKEFQGPTPYYHLTGRLVLAQMKYHSNEI